MSCSVTCTVSSVECVARLHERVLFLELKLARVVLRRTVAGDQPTLLRLQQEELTVRTELLAWMMTLVNLNMTHWEYEGTRQEPQIVEIPVDEFGCFISEAIMEELRVEEE